MSVWRTTIQLNMYNDKMNEFFKKDRSDILGYKIRTRLTLDMRYITFIYIQFFLKDEGVETSTIGYERRKDKGNAHGIQVNIKEISSECKYIRTN